MDLLVLLSRVSNRHRPFKKMPKASGKSSASSATRKKHQKKAAIALGIDLEVPAKPQGSTTTKPKNKDKSGRGKKDGKKAPPEPRVKAYIPPVKPARAQPDPLEVGGLARRLPPELVVVLRNVGKKAQVTKIRALEELGSAWIERALVGGGREEGVDVAMSLVEMIPAWVCLPPSLPSVVLMVVVFMTVCSGSLYPTPVYSPFSTCSVTLDLHPSKPPQNT